jgi:hypothetical protein
VSARWLCRAPRALSSLHRRSTYYEAGLFNRYGVLVAVLAYDAKRTNAALINAIYNHGPAIAELAGVDANDCDVKRGAYGYSIGDSGFYIRWTGLTEYQRASEALQAVA